MRRAWRYARTHGNRCERSTWTSLRTYSRVDERRTFATYFIGSFLSDVVFSLSIDLFGRLLVVELIREFLFFNLLLFSDSFVNACQSFIQSSGVSDLLGDVGFWFVFLEEFDDLFVGLVQSHN